MKIVKILAIVCLSAISAVLFSACGFRLGAPKDLSVDVDNKLTWTAVEDARRYIVQITDVDSGEETEVPAKKNAYSLSKLDEGDYVLRVRAVAGNKNQKDSKWSEEYSFKKAYETGCLYSLVNNVEYEVMKAGSASGEVRIEGTYRGKPVRGIADNAFKGCDTITSVILDENIEYIGKNAFNGCTNLQSITLPKSLKTIEQAAFKSCRALTSISIPDGVEVLPQEMFSYCRALESVSLGSGIKAIGAYAFSDCSALKTITIPDSVLVIGEYAFTANLALESVKIGKSLLQIGGYAFYRCETLTDLTFAANAELSVIGEYAFSQCVKLAKVEFPNQLQEIGYAAFYDCGALANVEIPNSVCRVRKFAFNATRIYTDAVEAQKPLIFVDGWIVACTVKSRLWSVMQEGIRLDAFDGAFYEYEQDFVGIADETFSSCKLLDRINLPVSVAYLGEKAFQNSSVTTVTLANSSITEIGSYAFYKCKQLSTIRLANSEGNSSIKRIASYAFYGCSLLNNDRYGNSIIPNSVESIGTYAFKNTGLWETPESDGLVYAGNWVVGYNRESITEVELKSDTRGIADYAFYQSKALTKVNKLFVAQFIGYGAFYECELLSVANIGSSVKKIEPYTFYKCVSITEMTLPSELTEIGRSAFYKCEHLGEIEIPSSVESIGAYAFYGCINLKKVTFKEEFNLDKMDWAGVKTIGDYSFYKCESVKELTLPNTLNTMGARAFGNCSSLNKVTLGTGLQAISERAFQNCVSLKEITVPANVKTIGKYAFYKCTGLRSVSLADGVSKIEDYAFYGVENLWKLNMPKSVNAIGKYAFKGCNGLQTVVLSSNVKEISAHAFYGCKSLTIYTDTQEDLEQWHGRWNSSYRPIVRGCTLSEDGTYVVSVTVSEDTVVNGKNALTAPKRDGYTFIGWDTNIEAKTCVYTAEQLKDAPVGTILYAVWEEKAEEIPPIPSQEEETEEE